MGRFIIVVTLEFLIALTLLTQVIAPLFVHKWRFFWFFRKKVSSPETTGVASLDVLNEEATKNKEGRDKLRENLSSAEKTLKEIKSKTN